MKKKFLSFILSVCTAAGIFSGVPVLASGSDTLQAMIDEAKDGETLVLSDDYNESVIISEGKNLTIDLNGHTLAGTTERTLVNNGILTIEDSTGEGGIVETGGASADCYGVVNNGTMTIADADIKCETTGNGFAQGVHNTGTLSVDGGEISAVTTGSKWAIALFNTGTVKQLNGNLTGEIKNTATADVNALAVSNEASGVIKEISGGNLIGRLDNNGIALGVRNRGLIQKISGGKIYAVTTGIKYAYGLHNEASGKIEEISGGRIIGNIDRETNGKNALGIRNNGTIESITGGEFRGNILGSGNAYGIRNDEGAVRNVSGGMYRGNNASNAIYIQGGTLTCAAGYEMLPDPDHVGYRYIAEQGSVYTEILDEYENHIATIFFDQNGNKLRTLGEVRDSYTVYQKYGEPVAKDRETAEQSAEDFSKTGKVVTLIAHTTDKPVYYFLGSSVTIGFANNGVSFADYMAKENDWICHKRAISGTTLVDSGIKSYVQRLDNDIPKNARIDHMICQLSTNDATQNKPLGSLSDSYDVDTLDRTTIYGALEYIAYYCRNVLNCELSFYTNPRYSNDLYTWMMDAVYEVADKWDLRVIDFYNYRNMEPLSAETLRSYMSDDIHPNADGYHWMANEMSKYLETYRPVVQQVEKITLDSDALILNVGDSIKLTAVVEPEDAADKTVVWSSSASDVAAVDESGKITALKAGEAVIAAESANGKRAVCQVTVKKLPAPEVQSITLNKETLVLNENECAQLTASVEPEEAADKTVTWSSSVSEIASVDENGKVTALFAGETMIIAETVNGKQAVCRVTVTKQDELPLPPKEVKVNAVKLSGKNVLTQGEKIILKAEVFPLDASNKEVSWSSTDPKTVMVDAATGAVMAKQAGKVEITATAKDGSGIKATIKMTVKPKKVTKLSVKMQKGKAIVSFKKVTGIKKYKIRLYKKGKLIKTAVAGKKAKITVNKKLKAGKYSVKVQYTKNGVTSDYAVKKFRVKK